ncbi:Fructosamine-3-kinase [Micrococcales bacterium KH10]|nr:Fructosamine-3-kinase [Micrococcales bacterium KH10]
MTGNVFVKRSDGRTNPLGEAAALRWLAEGESRCGVRIAPVLEVTAEELVLKRIDTTQATQEAAVALGRALARTHALGAQSWGCAPPDWRGPLYMGESRTPLVATADAPDTFGQFYAQYRIEPFLRQLRDRGDLGTDDAAVFSRLCDRLIAGHFDSAQPGLVAAAGCEVARIHGDLWTGNVLFDRHADAESAAVLIDPMAHGGHAETDLATLGVFGFSHLDEFYAGYDEVSALADGWRDRVALHELAIVILHAAVFGGGYIGSAVRLASQYR